MTFIQPTITVFCAVLQLIFIQIDLDSAAKITGLVMFFVIGAGGLVSFIYYLVSGRSRAELERNNKELTETNKSLRESNGDLKEKLLKFEKKDEKKDEKLLKQRKIILRQAARLEGEDLTIDDLDDL